MVKERRGREMSAQAFSIAGFSTGVSEENNGPDRTGRADAARLAPATWEQFIRQYAQPIYALCYRFAGSADRADDLRQEAFIKIFENLDRFDPSRGSFSTWVMSVLKNLLIDDYRKRRSEHQLVSIDDEDAAGDRRLVHGVACDRPGPEVQVERTERARILLAALECLPSYLREPVVLRDIYELSYEDIANTLRTPVGTVKSRISRGRTQLIRVLKRYRVSAP
jgi:RNA polymerase sigma-70 factor, ECF subfamily